MNRYWMETYGCQMNKAESNALERELEKTGWIEAGSEEDADLVILNTCSVRITAENRIWGRLGHFKTVKKTHPHTLVLMGCMAERLKDEIKNLNPAVDLVVGTFQKEAFLKFLHKEQAKISQNRLEETEEYRFAGNHTKGLEFKALVPIMHGCDNFCTYCIVPYVRGREISRSPSEIRAEFENLISAGVQEITLLGQNVNSYRFSLENGTVMNFPDLLKDLIKGYPSLKWLRFLTSHPKDLSEDLIACMRDHASVCKHLHLPVQHGSSKILAAMNRKYTRESYLILIDKLKKEIPGVTLTTDILIGFPGETEEDFQETMDLMRIVEFDDAFTYHYNPREGTKAFEMKDTVDEDIKLERLSRLIDLQQSISRRRKTARLGSRIQVLVENVSKKNDRELLSRSEKNEMVIFPGNRDLLGKFAEVELKSLRGNTFFAEETHC